MNNTQEECSGYPLTVGSVHGIRQWRVDRLGRLQGITYRDVWKPGENVARCARGEVSVPNFFFSFDPSPPRPKPCSGQKERCACGFYAYHDGVADYVTDEKNVVSGIIEGYGKTTVGTRGFRCAKAKVVALTVPKQPKWREHWWLGWMAFTAVMAAWNIAEIIRGADAWWQNGLAVAFLSVVTACYAFAYHKARRHRIDKTGDRFALLRRNYPDVQFFTSEKAMRAAFPPDKGLEPTPETDPEFWERKS